MKNIFLIITLATLVLIGGCNAANTETESAEFSSQISSSVLGSQITEFETDSDSAQESSSELSAPSASSSETISEGYYDIGAREAIAMAGIVGSSQMLLT